MCSGLVLPNMHGKYNFGHERVKFAYMVPWRVCWLNKRWWWIYLPSLWQIISTVDRQLCDLLLLWKTAFKLCFGLALLQIDYFDLSRMQHPFVTLECNGKNRFSLRLDNVLRVDVICFSLRLNNVLRVGFII